MGRRHTNPWALILALLWLVAGCSSRAPVKEIRDGAPTGQVDLDAIPDAIPRVEPLSRYGNPESYEVFGKRYYTLKTSHGHVERGIASWYGTKFDKQRTSSGEPYDVYAMTAAHRSLPLPTYARITNLGNGRQITVRINDRGPFHDNRIIDLSYVAAAKLGILAEGTGLVEIRAIDPRQPETYLAKTAPPTVEPVPTQSPGVYLQVGAFGSKSNADRVRRRLEQELPHTIRIQETVRMEQPLYRVQVGPIPSVEQSDALSLQLSQLGFGQAQVVVE